jgi:diacylglycerol kinase (ATP)
MNLKLIANPAAGSAALARIRRLVALLEQGGASVDLTLTTRRGDAQRAAAAAKDGGFQRIVAAGGDGTLNEVINGLAPGDLPLAFVPMGTANVFALEAGIPFDVEQACALALHGRPRPVYLGAANGRRFLLMAGVGFDAAVVGRVNLRLKRRFGKLAYLVSALQVLCGPPPGALQLTTDRGEQYRAYGAIVSNARLYGGRFVISPQADMQDDALAVCLFLRPGRFALLRTAVRIAVGRPPGPREVRQLRVQSLTATGNGIPVQIDGDYLGELPQTFQARFGELQVVFPSDR